MKVCFKCGISKPLDDFYKHGQMKDGRLNKCKECTKNDATKHRIERIYYYRAYDKQRASAPHRAQARKDYSRSEAGRLSHARALKRQRVKYPDKYRARTTFWNAVRDGKVVPWPVCCVPECNSKPEAHHPDYSRPLDVVWLCSVHHKQVHAMANKILKTA